MVAGQARELGLQRAPQRALRAAQRPRRLVHFGVQASGGDHDQRSVGEGPDADGKRLAGSQIDAVDDRVGEVAPESGGLGLRPNGELAPRLIATHGVDQDDSGDAVGMLVRVQAGQQPP